MDETLKTEITKIALGYGLQYKISNMRMETYLAPEYGQLKKRHPELHYEEFIEELTKAREQARKGAGGASAKELNRTLLSALRKVEKRTTLRAEWSSGDTTERFFDYVLKKTVKN